MSHNISFAGFIVDRSFGESLSHQPQDLRRRVNKVVPLKPRSPHLLRDCPLPIMTYVLENRWQGTLRQEIATAFQQTGCDSGGRQHFCRQLGFAYVYLGKFTQIIRLSQNCDELIWCFTRRRIVCVLFHVCAKNERMKDENDWYIMCGWWWLKIIIKNERGGRREMW